MVLLVLGHLFIMHYQRAPVATGTAFVGRRWAGGGWRAFDLVLLLLALTHGVAGAHGVLRERLRSPTAAKVIDGVCIAAALAFASLGTVVIAVGARAAGSGPGPLSGQIWIPAVLVAGLAGLATLTYLTLLSAAVALGARLLGASPIGRWSYPGQWAFTLSRVAGLGVLGFLLLHILDVALVPFAPDLYEQTVAGYALPYLMPMEVLLVGAVVYHSLNGVRVVVLEALDRRAAGAYDPSFVLVVVVTALLVLPSLLILLHTRP